MCFLTANGASAFEWDGSTSEDWFDATNWDGGVVPNSTENAVLDTITPNPTKITDQSSNGTATANLVDVGYDNEGSLTISEGGQLDSYSSILGRNAGAVGTAVITGAGSSWDNQDHLSVGEDGRGYLTISEGATVSSDEGYVGYSAGAYGEVEVTGAGSTWVDTYEFYLGPSGEGHLTISEGGTVNLEDAYFGYYSGGVGVAAVTGTGSTLEVADEFSVGGDGEGSLTISEGASVSAFYSYLGYNDDSIGTAVVTGAGSSWQNTRYLSVGEDGHGTLRVLDGGEVISGQGFLGYAAGASGTVVVSGENSVWSNTGIRHDGSPPQADWEKYALSIGSSGSGSLTISDGGTVTADVVDVIGAVIIAEEDSGEGTINIGSAAGETAVAPGFLETSTIEFGDGTGTLVFNHTDETGDFQFGAQLVSITSDPNGSILGTHTILQESGLTSLTGDNSGFAGETMVDGGTLSIENTLAGTKGYIGYSGGSNGAVEVVGFGSAWENSSNLYVGYYGIGSLKVSDGGLVKSLGGSIGWDNDSYGSVTVSGTGSLWDNSGNIYVGSEGQGYLTISDGGVVNNSGEVIMGYYHDSEGTAVVTGAGSEWRNTGSFTVGGFEDAHLLIADGGLVSNTYGYIGYQDTSTGDVIVTGTGSTWTNTDKLSVGFWGNGNLTISDGATVNTNSSTIGYYYDVVGSAIVTGSGSLWSDSASMLIGHVGSGTLTISDSAIVDVVGGVTLAEDDISDGTVNIGAASGETALAPGTLDTPSMRFDDGTGTLVFNHTDETGDYEFAVDLISSGTGTHSIKHEAGWTGLTGDNSAFTGITTLSGGTLSVADALGGVVNVQSGATLAGVGTLSGQVTIESGGTLSAGNSIGTLTVSDLAFHDGSNFSVEVDENGNSDQIVATGDVTIAGGTLSISGVLGTDLTYTIITAGGTVTGEFDEPSSSVFVSNSLLYDTDAVYLSSTRVASFCDLAASANQAAIACDGLDSLDVSSDLAQILLSLTTEDEAREAYDALSGQIHSSLKSALLENSQHSVASVNRRMHSAFAGKNGAESDQNGFWAEGFGSWSNRSARMATAQMDNNMGGVIIGFDMPAYDIWRFGALGGYSKTEVEQSALSSSASVDTWSFGLYGGAETEASLLSFGAIYNRHSADTSRTASFAGFSEAHSAEYNADSWQVFAEAGRKVQLQDLMLEPFAGLSYVGLRTDGFSEDGETSNLTAAADWNHAVFTTLGLRSAVQLSDKLTAKGMVGWRHALGDTAPDTTFQFASSDPFSITGAPIADEAFVTDVGLEGSLNQTTTVKAAYNGQFGSGTSAHSLNFSARILF